MRTISALVGKAYSSAGQAAAYLHTMYLLQAYQAELLGYHDEEVVVTALGNRFVSQGYGSTWWPLRDIKIKEKNILMGSQPQPSKCKTDLRTVIISKKAAV